MVAWLVLAFFVSARVRHSWNDGGTRHVFILPPDNCVVNGVGTFVLPAFLWLVFFHPYSLLRLCLVCVWERTWACR